MQRVFFSNKENRNLESMAVKLYILAGSLHERKLLRLLEDLGDQKKLVDGILLLNNQLPLTERYFSRFRRIFNRLSQALIRRLTQLVHFNAVPDSWNLSGANSWDLLELSNSPAELLSGIPVIERFQLNLYYLKSLKANDDDQVYIAAYAGGFFSRELLGQAGIAFLNAHMGRMPKYRGMAAIEWAMLNQDEPYVSVMKIASAIDGGDELFEVPINVNGCDDIASLRKRGYEACSKAMALAFQQLKRGLMTFKAQEGRPRYNYRMHPFTRKELTTRLGCRSSLG